MHLGINAIRFCRNFTGVGRYMECVLKEWADMDLPFDRVTLFTHTPLDPGKLAFPLDRYERRVVGRVLPDPIWESTALRAAARDVDVFFGPSYTLPLGIRGKCVVTNHGPAENTPLSYQWFRSQAYEALYMTSARRADRVLVNSRAVERRVIDVYRVAPAKITVTHLAASDLFRPVRDEGMRSEILAKYGIAEGPFILFVGKLARRHYIPDLVEAFARIKHELRVPHRLVLVGPDYLNLDVAGLARRRGVETSVTHVPYAVHEDLPAIYSAASFFVFPASEAEGFGIPVVEAMACGTPVVTTALGSLREVAVGAALTTDAPTADALAEAMKAMATDEALRETHAALGLERARQFTWRITARKTMDVLWEVAAAQDSGRSRSA